MFGYKLFSIFLPLCLLNQGLSLPKIGFVYLLIYLPIAISAPFVGYLNYKVKPSILVAMGILGYALYSLGMILVPVSFAFYLLQVVLGISATLFFVSYRVVLIDTHPSRLSHSFAWFFSAPYYAQELAPIIGALLIFKWGFTGVFIVSLLVHVMNIIFTVFDFSQTSNTLKTTDGERIKESLSHFGKVVNRSLKPPFLSPVLISFSILLVGGFYQAFFPAYLKNLGWSQNEILLYLSIFAFLFVPFALYSIHRFSKEDEANDIFKGGLLFGIVSFLFGWGRGALSNIEILVLMELAEFGSFLTSTGRSGLLSRAFAFYEREVAAFDTVFSPLAVALGAMIGGLLIGSVGYFALFAGGGIFVLMITLFSRLLRR